jgi:hypothetical protein
MTAKKFKSEVETLQKFFQIYCYEKHKEQFEKEYNVHYKDLNLIFKANFCNKCHSLLSYAIERLQECPHDPKPRCRKCKNPCYEKDKYKQMAKMMRFSGMKLGVNKAVQKLKKFLKRIK